MRNWLLGTLDLAARRRAEVRARGSSALLAAAGLLGVVAEAWGFREAAIVAVLLGATAALTLTLSLARMGKAMRDADRDIEAMQQRMYALIEAVPACMELYDTDDRLVLHNRQLAETFPYMADWLSMQLTFAELARKAHESGVHAHWSGTIDEWIALRQAQRRNPEPGPTSLMHTLQGQWLQTYERRLPGGELLSIRMDVTKLEQQRRELDQARADVAITNARLQDAIEALPAGFELYDARDRLLMSNQVMRKFYPRIAHLLDGQPTFEQIVRANHAAGGLSPTLFEGDFETWLGERLAQRRTPREPRVHELADGLWVRTYERRTREGGLVGVRIDVSELMNHRRELERLNDQLDRANTELAHLSDTDALTGLANRRHFDRRLTEEWSRHERYGMPLAVALIDVDHFKRYNDLHGHLAGDACLRQVAQALRVGARRATDLLARYGGEEFVLLLPHCEEEEARAQLQRCFEALAALALPHGASPVDAVVGVSAGLAMADGRGSSTFIADADRALYQAKALGRGRFEVAEPAERSLSSAG